MRELCRHHISGQLRVAPEHVDNDVLELMGKPEHEVYIKFLDEYKKVNDKTGKEQYVVPYLMSSHPGSTLKSAIKLAEYIRDLGYIPDQVQDFYPTPSTVSTCMYYTGVNPLTMKKVYVPKDPKEKAMQRALIQYKRPENYELVKKALIKAHREDLIGYGPKCLIPSRPYKNENVNNNEKKDGAVKGRAKKEIIKDGTRRNRTKKDIIDKDKISKENGRLKNKNNGRRNNNKRRNGK